MNRTLLQIFILNLILGIFPCELQSQSVHEALQDIIHSKELVNLPMKTFFPRSIYKDNFGFMWMGTRDKLVRFDGIHVKEYSYHPKLNPNMLTLGPDRILEDSEGKIWLASKTNGLAYLDQEKNQFHRFHPSGFDSGIASHRIRDIFMDQDSSLWISTAKVLHLYLQHNDKFIQYPIDKSLIHSENIILGDISQDVLNKDILWMACNQGLIQFKISNQQFHLIKFPTQIKEHYSIWSQPIYCDNLGQVWIGHFNGGGIKMYNTITKKWTEHITVDQEFDLQLGRTRIMHIEPYSDSLLLGASFFNHFYLINKYDPQEFAILPYNPVNANCQGLLIHNDNIFLGMENQLLKFSSESSKISYVPFNFSPGEREKSNFQNHFYYDSTENVYYISTSSGDGLIKYDYRHNKLKNYAFKSKSGFNNIDVPLKFAFRYSDTIWALSNEGLFYVNQKYNRLEKDQKQRFKLPLSFEDIYLKDHDLYILDKEGQLTRTSLKNGSINKMHIQSKEHHLIPERIETLRLFNQDFLVKQKSQFFHLARNDGRITKLGYPPVLLNSLKANKFTDFQIEQDTIWAGSDGMGLFKLIVHQDSIIGFEQYISQDNSGSNSVNQILITKSGNIWFANHFGFSYFNRSSKKFTHLGMEDGIGFAPRNGLLIERKDGAIMASARSGFQYFFTNDVLKKNLSVQPYLANLEINNEPIEISKNLPLLEFNSNISNVKFTMGAANWNKNPTNYYHYRLKDIDNNWSIMNTTNTVNYNNLVGGDYEFQFSATATSDFNKLNTINIPFSIEKAWHETLLFKLSLVALVGLLAAFFWNFKKRRYEIQQKLLKQENELERIQRENVELEMAALRSRMNPHFLFNSLNAIKLYILKENKKSASKYLSQFAGLMRKVLAYSELIEISLDKELDLLSLYIDLEKMRLKNSFHSHISVEPQMNTSNYSIPPLLLQPFVENAIWHGLTPLEIPGKLIIKVYEKHNQLIIEIEDNGVGRKKNNAIHQKENYTSSGIKITRKRLNSFDKRKQHVVLSTIKYIDHLDSEQKPCGTTVKITLGRK